MNSKKTTEHQQTIHSNYPGTSESLTPEPDYGENNYSGNNKLKDKVALITGGDSGIGRAIAIAFAAEGADIIINYLSENTDADYTKRCVEKRGRRCITIKKDIRLKENCEFIIATTIKTFNKIDILVNVAGFQMERKNITDISDDEFNRTLETNLHSMFYLCRLMAKKMQSGGCIINTSSINAYTPKSDLLIYSMTKAAIINFTGGLAQMFAPLGIRVNAVAPGPIWTPLIPATMFPEHVKNFGSDTPMKRFGQPKEVAIPYVMLASDEASYISGSVIGVTGGILTL